MIGRLLRGSAVVVLAVSASVIVTSLTVGQADPVARPTDDAPPATAALTVQRLDRRLVFRGTLERTERPIERTGIVSALPLDDTGRVEPGAAVLEVEGRPLLALPLPFPLWRDLGPDAQGRDVAAVQHALSQLGLFDGEADGTFGASTQEAVEALYARAGYDPPASATLSAAEVIHVEDGMELALDGARVGDVLGAGALPRLRTARVELVVVDGGTLAEAAEPGTTILLGTDRQQPSAHTVARAETVGEESRVALSGEEPGIGTGELTSGALVLAGSDGEVLAAPTSAIRVAADGGEVVEVLDGDGRRSPVPVEVGFRGDELVEIRGADLRAGDRVVVGD